MKDCHEMGVMHFELFNRNNKIIADYFKNWKKESNKKVLRNQTTWDVGVGRLPVKLNITWNTHKQIIKKKSRGL